jgi:hypothetical protein
LVDDRARLVQGQAAHSFEKMTCKVFRSCR